MSQDRFQLLILYVKSLVNLIKKKDFKELIILNAARCLDDDLVELYNAATASQNLKTFVFVPGFIINEDLNS